ncbi:hypothetical protein KAR91_64390 [Candidatus Pacearchaeota archaeon]|nr:hypothetical protein [Candidatus Pacearchaeota archaeon]
MYEIINYTKKLIICTLLSMFATAITAFIITRKSEVIAGASLFGLFILPSIFVYYTLDFFRKSHKAKTMGYVFPIVGWAIYLVVCIILDAQRQSSEGAGEMAALILISIFFGGAVVYILMSKMKWLK